VTEQEAINVLNEVGAKYHGTRQDHAMITSAIDTLRRAVDLLDVLRRERVEQQEAAKEAAPPDDEPPTH